MLEGDVDAISERESKQREDVPVDCDVVKELVCKTAH